MSKYTFVVEFEDGKEPSVSGATDILGGRVLHISFSDVRDNLLTSEEDSTLVAILKEDPEFSAEICEEYGASFDDIINKLDD